MTCAGVWTDAIGMRARGKLFRIVHTVSAQRSGAYTQGFGLCKWLSHKQFVMLFS
jgi:hypothetical protein